MPVFSVTAAINSVTIDAKGKGESFFTVSNVSGRPLRARAEVKAADPPQQAWLTIADQAERNFVVNGTHQFAVQISVPSGSPAGTYQFRLDIVSEENPDDDFAEGPPVSFVVGESKAPRRPFPWWIAAVAAVVLVIGGVGAWLYLSKRPVTVPDLAGKTVADARNQLSSLGLNVTVRPESHPHPLAAPVLSLPPDESKFEHVPRETTLVWQPVQGAASYTLEIDCFQCCGRGSWCSDVGQTYKKVAALTSTSHKFNWVGAQPGRWRVWAKAAPDSVVSQSVAPNSEAKSGQAIELVTSQGGEGQKSDWRRFTYIR